MNYIYGHVRDGGAAVVPKYWRTIVNYDSNNEKDWGPF